MSSFVFGGSILAAFLGGGIALLAPCCITFLLPAYFASAFRQRSALLKMTFVFAAGIAVVLVPIALGLAALASFFSRYHRELNIAGGALLMVLGLLALAGKGMMPMLRPALDLKRHDPLAVLGLGMFSGVASSCCTPVLAGVFTLAALSSSLVQASLLSLAYVAGMVFPMLVLAYVWDERGWARSGLLQGKRFTVSLGPWRAIVHSTNLAAGLLFLIMGVIVFAFGITGGSIYAPAWQTALSTWLSRNVQILLLRLAPTMEAALGGAILLLIALLALRATRRSRRQRRADRQSAPAVSETPEP